MVCVTRTITLEEYGEANTLSLANGTRKQRWNYLLFIKYGPYIGIVLLIVGLPLVYYGLRGPGGDYTMGVLAVSLAVVFLVQRWGLSRRLKKLYKAQQLDSSWTVTVSESGVQSTLVNLTDAHVQWEYFTTYT